MWRVVAAALVALAAVGCGTSAARITAGAGLTPVPDNAPPAPADPKPVADVWSGSLELQFAAATFRASGYGVSGLISVPVVFVNHGTQPAMLDVGDVRLVQGQASHEAGFSTLPVVDTGATARGRLAFWADEGYDPNSAVVILGPADGNQSAVPLGHPESTLTVAPRDQTFLAGGHDASLALAVHGAHFEAKTGKGAKGLGVLRLTFDATFTGPDPLGRIVDGRLLSLQVPGGAVIPATVTGVDDSAFGQARPGAPLTGLTATFDVPMPLAGKCVLLYGDAGQPPIKVPFTFA
jgi:hypothetical protein